MPTAFGFSLYECRNSLERSINETEKVADVLSKWDLYSRVENDATEVKLTFKVKIRSNVCFSDSVLLNKM